MVFSNYYTKDTDFYPMVQVTGSHFNFTANFGSEEACRLHFKDQRDKIGVECKCGSKEHFWIQSRWSYECKKCRSRISLRSGTMELLPLSGRII